MLNIRWIIFCVCCFTSVAFSQPDQWIWIKGDSANNPSAIYGTMGTPGAANKPRGAYEAAEWTDKYGNFWLFTGGSGFHNTMWRYNPTTNEWTWMNGNSVPLQHGVYGTKGIPSPLNSPGGRMAGVATWTDTAGYLWLFGGFGFDESSFSASYLNDLWRYDPNPLSPTFNQWTWMNGSKLIDQKGTYGVKTVAAPNNTPGARFETSCTWVDDNNNLWLFGGLGKDSLGGFALGVLNDLWMYHIPTNQWTWMNGDPLIAQNGDYFTQGISNTNSKPGGRMCYSSWKNLNGKLYLYGGNGLDSTSATPGYLDDMWMYDPDPTSPTFNQWTWISGSPTIAAQSATSYGTKCVQSASNYPGTRFETRARWTDACGNFWMFGGGGAPAQSNDLWKYNPSVGMWTWISGDNTPGTQGYYGTQGVASILNKPGSLNGANAWINDKGLWLYGGTGILSESNDLWIYIPDTVSASFTTDTLTGCAPLTVNFSNTSNSNCSEILSYYWEFNDPSSGILNTSTSDNPSHTFNTGGNTYTVSLVVTSCTGQKDTATKVISTSGGATINILPATSVSICEGDSLVLTAGGALTYNWSPSNGISSTTGAAIKVYPTSTTTYTVVGYDTNGCSGSVSALINVSQQANAFAGNDTTICVGSFAQLNASGGSAFLWSTGSTNSSISVSPTVTTSYSLTAFNGICSDVDEIDITVLPLPIVTAGSNTIITQGNSVQLTATGNGNYSWTPATTLSCSTCINPIASPLQTTKYILTVTDSNGCSSSDTVLITVEIKECDFLFVPNVFSPNNDAQNDMECILSNCIKEATFIIFNRWGEIVFETNDYTKCWDGKHKNQEASSGVYVYSVFGTFINGQQFTKKGNISLLR